MVFQTDCDEIKLQKSLRHFSDVITITSPKIVTKITSKFFPFWLPPNQNFWLRQCIPGNKTVKYCIIRIDKATGIMALENFTGIG